MKTEVSKEVIRKAKKLALDSINKNRQEFNSNSEHLKKMPILMSIGKLWWNKYGSEWIEKSQSEMV